MDDLPRIQLGRSDLEVPRLGVRAMTWSSPGQEPVGTGEAGRLACGTAERGLLAPLSSITRMALASYGTLVNKAASVPPHGMD